MHARQAERRARSISMELVDGADTARVPRSLKIFSHAVSLGGIESLVVRPALAWCRPHCRRTATSTA